MVGGGVTVSYRLEIWFENPVLDNVLAQSLTFFRICGQLKSFFDTIYVISHILCGGRT